MSKKIEPKEALKVVKDNIHYSLYELKEATKNNTNSRLIRSIRTLDELVDKATPKKPYKESLYDRICTVCNSHVDLNEKPDLCRCGQALDWSENE